MSALLPSQFEAVAKFCNEWVLPDSNARNEKRLATEFDDIKAFYDAMLPLAPDILEYLKQRPLGSLNQQDTNLLKLMLSLAEVGPAVEWYEQPAVVDGWPAQRFPLVEQLSDTEAQEH